MYKQSGGTTIYAPGMRRGFLGIPQYGAGIRGGWFPFKGLIERGIEANKKGQLGGKRQRRRNLKGGWIRGLIESAKKRQVGGGMKKKRQRKWVEKKTKRR